MELEIVDFECQYCGKMFNDEKSMKVHQEKKQKGKKIGCKINYERNLRSESRKGSVSMVSSPLSYPVNSITSSQFENLSITSPQCEAYLNAGENDSNGDSDSDNEVDLVEVNRGEGDIPQVTGDLESHCLHIKRSLSNSVTNLASLSFCHGQVKSAVRSIRQHSDFNAGSLPGWDEIVRNREKRERFFKLVYVDVTQNDALIPHKCKISECTATCTFGRRKALFHSQSAFFALEVVRTTKGLSSWIDAAASHLRRLKVEANSVYKTALSMIMRLYGPDLGQKIEVLKDEHTAAIDTASEVRRPKAPEAPGLQVSVKRLQKGEKR